MKPRRDLDDSGVAPQRAGEDHLVGVRLQTVLLHKRVDLKLPSAFVSWDVWEFAELLHQITLVGLADFRVPPPDLVLTVVLGRGPLRPAPIFLRERPGELL